MVYCGCKPPLKPKTAPVPMIAPVANPISANCSSNNLIKTAMAASRKMNAPAASRYRIFSVNNKATRPLPVGPVVVPVPVTRINALAAPANALANGPVDDRVSLAKVAKVGAPVSEAPARVDSPEARAGAQVAPVANSPLAVLWLKHWMPTVTVSFLPLN